MVSSVFDRQPEEVAGLYQTSDTAGLSSKEAKKRLRYFGQNKIYNVSPPDTVGQVLRLVFSPSGILFFTISLICAAIHIKGSFVALAIWLVAMVTLSFIKVRSSGIISTLKACGIPRARVIRDGRPRLIDSRALVPGDLLLVSEGDVVSADCRIIHTDALKVREPYGPDDFRVSDKYADACPEAIAPSEMYNMVFAGSTVTHGAARAIVSATGSDTLIISDNGGALLSLREKSECFALKNAKKTGIVLSSVSLAVLMVLCVILLVAAPTSPMEYFLAASSAFVFWLGGAYGVLTEYAVSSSVKNVASASGNKAIIKNIGSLDAIAACDALICGESFASAFIDSIYEECCAYALRVYITARPESAVALAERCGAFIAATPDDAMNVKGHRPVVVVCRSPLDRAKLAAGLSANGYVTASVASQSGHIGMFNSSHASFCCAALELPTKKITDITLEDIDRTAGNEAMMKNSDVICQPTVSSVLFTVSSVRALMHRLYAMESVAVSAFTAVSLSVFVTVLQSGVSFNHVSAVIASFPILLIGLMLSAISGTGSFYRVAYSERRSGLLFSFVSAATWLIMLFAVRMFSEQLLFDIGSRASGYYSASLMLYIAFSSLFAYPYKTKGSFNLLRPIPLVISLMTLGAAVLIPVFGNTICPGINVYILLLSVVTAFVPSALTAVNRSVYNKLQFYK